jgi:hypothetical protein
MMVMKGVTTGMARMQYQDWLFEVNDRPDRRLTDGEIAEEMNREHPTGKRIPAAQVQSIRACYNAGRNGHGPPPGGRQSHRYD